MARSSRGRRADYQWSGNTGFQTTISGTQLLGSGAVAINTPGTIVRVRGHCAAALDVGAADNAMIIGAGLIVVDDDAVAAGAASIPSPIDDLDADWLWHGFFALNSISGTQGDANGGQHSQREIDSKAMRRVKQNSNIVMMIDGDVLAGSPTGDFFYGFRALLSS